MKRQRTRVLKTTPWEERMIAELTSRSAFDRVDAGEAEIVDPDDWSDVPVLSDEHTLVVPKKVFRALEAASRKKRTTPRRLALRLLREGLLEKKTG
jgi:hypothetical protein